MITGKWYDRLKWLAQIVLPALGALYIALAALWDLPKPQEVAGTILAIDTFLGVILGISQTKYNNSDEKYSGTLLVRPKGDGTGTVDLNLGSNHPDDLAEKDEVILKVKKGKKAKGGNLVDPDAPLRRGRRIG